MAGMADEDDLAAFAEMPVGLDMDLVHQGAGRIEEEHVARLRVRGHCLGDTVGREHDRGFAGRNFVQLFDEHGTLLPQSIDHIFVMHDRMPHIDRSAVFLERQLDDLDRAIHPGAEPARGAKRDIELWLGHIHADAFWRTPSQGPLRRAKAAGTIGVQPIQGIAR